MKRIALAGAVAALIVGGVPIPASASTPAPVCSDVHIPVALTDGAPETYTMYGRLCQPSTGPSKTIQILVHGITYDHNYWDLPGFSGMYDYSGVQNAAGYTTLAVDRLGSAGQSSIPPSTLLNLASDAVSIHDVVQAARGGSIPGGPYGKVLMVGHSYGSAIAWQEDTTYADVDGIISSGLGHLLGNLQGLGTSLEPPVLDPRLSPLVGLDVGYLTTLPGTRGALFYNAPDTDPAVVAYDESTKGLVSATELGTIPEFEVGSLGVTAPMFMVMGQDDGFFCQQAGKGGLDDCATDQTLYDSEAPFFPGSVMQTYVLPSSGHDLNNELNAGAWYAQAAAWASSHVPPQG